MTAFPADESLAPPNQKVLAAVSSGADSLALLWWLLEIGREVVVGHVHHDLHELRAGECDADEEFVRQKCATLKIELATRKVALPRKNGHVNEAVAREARYAALAEMARETGCPIVATAHTATDNLETALLNLSRGAGAAGWAGFAPQRKLEGEISLVRPLWRVARNQTRAILRENNWDWREDESNHDPVFRRNRIRHELLPVLGDVAGKEADEIALSHAQSALVWREEARFLDELTAHTLENLVKKRETGLLVLDGATWTKFSIALQRRVLRRAALELAPELRDLNFEKIEMARLHISENRRRAVWQWSRNLSVEWTGESGGNRIRLWRV